MSMERIMGAEIPQRLDAKTETLERAADLDEFLREVERRAYRIALVTVRDADECLDIVQDAMLRLVTRYGRRPSTEWRPLFYRILQNRIRDWHRRSAVRNRIFVWFGAEDRDAIAEAPDVDSVDPLDELSSAAALEALSAALRQLPARQREAFMLRNFEGLDVGETAIAMGCSDGSVKTHHARAVGRLRQLLGEDWS
jgi:RNA polymerase sigma-70 factor, ECF subfamily